MTGLYVDTSALLERVFDEPDSSDLRVILRGRTARGDLLVSSDLTWVEVSRAILRAGATDVAEQVVDACSGIALPRLTPEILRRAERIGLPERRSLDAIHLAAAVQVGAAELLTFDRRLAEAAVVLGIHVIGGVTGTGG